MHPRISVISRADGLRVALQRSVFPNLEMHVLPVALTSFRIFIFSIFYLYIFKCFFAKK